MFKRMYDKAHATLDRVLIPPVKRFAKNHPWKWKLFVAFLIILPFGIMGAMFLNFLLLAIFY